MFSYIGAFKLMTGGKEVTFFFHLLSLHFYNES